MSRTSGQNRYFWLAGKREPAQDLFFKEALDPAIWAEGSSELWSTCWYTGMPAPEVFERLGPGCSINHIPGNNGLTVKSNLYATLARTREHITEQAGDDSEFARRMDFFPRTFMMPNEYAALQEAAARNPEKRWILKPKNSARGKGISLVRDTADVPRDSAFMVQEYMDKPHTMNGHKYVLRLYVLITSVEPLRVYMYQEGSAKLASEPYDPNDPDNIYAHLTNPDVNATNAASETPVVFISFANYRGWLREQGHDDAALFQRIRDLLTLTIISVREHMRSRLKRITAPTSGCYELLGIDCLVDTALKPHILECNLSPSLEVCAAPQDGGDVEARNKRQLVTDMVNLLGLNATPRRSARLAPAERLVETARLELERAGGFQRLYPTEGATRYLPYFPYPRLADIVLADAVTGASVPRPPVRARGVAEMIDDDGLALYSERAGTLFRPNETAAWIWLMATDGVPADTIAHRLLEASEGPKDPEHIWEVRQRVWDTLADWARDGLLLQGDSRPPAGTGDPAGSVSAGRHRFSQTRQAESGPEELTVSTGGGAIVLSTESQAVARRVLPAFVPLSTPPGDGPDKPDRLQIVSAHTGYAVTNAQRLIGQDLALEDVVSLVSETLLRGALVETGMLGLQGVLLGLTPGGPPSCSALVIPAAGGSAADNRNPLVTGLARSPDRPVAGGVLLETDPEPRVRAMGLPYVSREQASGADAPHTGLHAWRLLPASRELIGIPQTVPVVLIQAETQPSDNGAAPALQELTAGQALASMLPRCVGPDAGHLAAASVSALYDWLSGRAIYRVDTGNGGVAAAKALLEGIATPAGDVVTDQVGH
ncbi:MAG: hypothetical protein JJT90_09530 [Ectothiorhodospiraceae bacterium]|nr:hypothetical protein [Ectothiorhodospiraceae bacterium]